MDYDRTCKDSYASIQYSAYKSTKRRARRARYPDVETNGQHTNSTAEPLDGSKHSASDSAEFYATQHGDPEIVLPS